MTDFPLLDQATWMYASGCILVLLVAWLIYRRRRAGDRLQRVLDDIGYDRVDGILVPSVDGGEIQIDHLLLTSKGLLILDIKDVAGTVFGGDKMDNWTVIGHRHRFTFSNPLPALYDRVAAVRHIVRQVPVEGRVVFLDDARFSKGVPDKVADIDQLHAEFGEPDKAAARFKIDAFKSHWDLLRKAALDSSFEAFPERREA